MSNRASIVGSELKAFTMSKRFSGSTDPSSLKYVTLLYHKISNHIGCKSIDQEEDKMSAHLTHACTHNRDSLLHVGVEQISFNDVQ